MGRAERRPKKPEREEPNPPRRRSGISDVLRWMDDAEPASAKPPTSPPTERVAQGRRPIQVKKPSREAAPPPAKTPAKVPTKIEEPPAPAASSRKKKSKKRRVSEPALEPIKKRPRSGETAQWGAAAVSPAPSAPQAAPPVRRDLEEALSWMDSAESRPLPEAPPSARPEGRAGERPRTGKVEAVLSWMDELSGPFEDVKRGKRPAASGHSGRGLQPGLAAPSAPSARQGAGEGRRPTGRLERQGAGEGRRPTGKLERRAVDEILARAERVKTARVPAPPPPPAPPAPQAAEADLGPPEEGFGPLSKSDVWMLAQTPEDVLAGARRPRSDLGLIDEPHTDELEPDELEPEELELETPELGEPLSARREPDLEPLGLSAPPPSPPPLPRLHGEPDRPSDVARATRRAKVEELLEWTQDLLGTLDDSSEEELVVPPERERDPAATTTEIFEIELELPDDPDPEPDPPRKRSSRLLRLQEQLRARSLETPPPPPPQQWSTLPDSDALGRLERVMAARGHGGAPPSRPHPQAPDPFQDDPLADLDPFAAVLPPAPELPRDPRCRDPFCMDPRCLRGPEQPQAPRSSPPRPPQVQAQAWGNQARIVPPRRRSDKNRAG